MLSRSRFTALAFGALAALTIAACSGGGADRAAADSAAAGQDSAMADNTAEVDDRWDIKPGEVDAWVRGLEGGTDSIRIASKHARSLGRDARIQAYSQMIPVAFMGPEVRASRLPEDRYVEVANNLHDAYNALTGNADSATSAEILRHLRPDARETLERRVSRVREIYAEREKLIAQAGGYDSLLTKP